MITETKIREALSMESLIESRSIPVDTSPLIVADLPAGYKAFNPSGVFMVDGAPLVAVRVDPPGDELASQSIICRYDQSGKPLERFGDWSRPWQDPFAARIQKQLVLGGVRIERNPDNPSIVDNYQMEILIGSSLNNLAPLCTGPPRQKDIRLVDMSDDHSEQVGVFGRPQFGHASGEISFTKIKNVYDLSSEVIKTAKIITGGLFEEGTWCGVNDAVYLGDGQIAVLGHLARYNPNNPLLKQYAGLKFMFDSNTEELYNIAIFAVRKDLPVTYFEELSPETEDVVFAGGFHYEDVERASRITRLGGKAVKVFRVTLGISDAAFCNSIISYGANA